MISFNLNKGTLSLLKSLMKPFVVKFHESNGELLLLSSLLISVKRFQCVGLLTFRTGSWIQKIHNRVMRKEDSRKSLRFFFFF